MPLPNCVPKMGNGHIPISLSILPFDEKIMRTNKITILIGNRNTGKTVYAKSIMKAALESCPNLTVVQGECAEILTDEDKVTGFRLTSGAEYGCSVIVLATGTFLGAKTFTGRVSARSGFVTILPTG